MGVDRNAQDAIAKKSALQSKDAIVKDTAMSVRANFGLPDWLMRTFLTKGGVGRSTFALMQLFASPLLKVVFYLVRPLPWRFKNMCAVSAWKLWLALHRILPASIFRRGISDSVSLEVHAMHNVMWWFRLFPCPIWSMRFALSQLSMNFPPQGAPVEWIDSPTTPGLRSAYVRVLPPSEAKPRVLLWAFGGAFVAGDVEGNMGPAEHYGRKLGCDVFLVDMRLCPESKVQDAVLDLYHGYELLLQRVPAENIVMLGISSGGGSVVRVLQLARSDDATRREYFGERRPFPPALPQPAGAILLGAFVDYTKVGDGIQRNSAFDWIVSPSVVESIAELQNELGGGAHLLHLCSPLLQDMTGLCPLMISVSEHEGLFDEDVALAAKAQAAGVDVVLSTTPFLCHVFQLFSCYLPEAAEEELRIFDWVKSKGGVWA